MSFMYGPQGVYRGVARRRERRLRRHQHGRAVSHPPGRFHARLVRWLLMSLSTLSLVTVGHRDMFDINVPVIILKF